VLADWVTWAGEQLAENDILAGIIGGSAFASGLYALRSAPARAWEVLRHQGTCELTIYSDDPAFEWVDAWLDRQPYSRRARRLKLVGAGIETGVPGQSESGKRRPWKLVPGPGAHLLWHRGRPLLLTRAVSDPKEGARRFSETLTFACLGRSQETLRRLVAETQELSEGEKFVDVLDYGDGYWRRCARKRPRDLESVVLQRGQIERVVEDAEWFFRAEEWYLARGVPHRRGYLLHGEPGVGKSSLVLALASHLGRQLYTLNLGGILGDQALISALGEVPAGAILLIEDIDATRASARRDAGKKKKDDEGVLGASQSALLNALDGVASADGRLLVMTTNRPEDLDPALVRPGRVDLTEKLLPLDGRGAARLFLRFYRGQERLSSRLGTELTESYTAARLQAHFMLHRDSPDDAVELLLAGLV
jgi:chaperone BCS1